jgi:hypothetical protein
MRRPDLVPDCGSCDAICCVATSFDASEDFAISKAAGLACPNVTTTHQCAIHGALTERGFSGCSVYECYGAGPRITKRFAGRSSQRQRDDAFLVMRVVHELLWQLTEAAKLCPVSRDDLASELSREIAALDVIAQAPTPALLATDLRPHEKSARAALRRIGEALGGRRVHLRVMAETPRE